MAQVQASRLEFGIEFWGFGALGFGFLGFGFLGFGFWVQGSGFRALCLGFGVLYRRCLVGVSVFGFGVLGFLVSDMDFKCA
jgi:hypothetical protein